MHVEETGERTCDAEQIKTQIRERERNKIKNKT